ncbi:MAG: hypothetical protein AAF802_20370 [Planctomycetota bacterium]
MTESDRIARLTALLHGTGASVNDAYGVWALESTLSDEHIIELAEWADLPTDFDLVSGTVGNGRHVDDMILKRD